MKTPPTSRRKPGQSKELIQSLDALDRASALIHRIEAQCAVLQVAAKSPNAEEIRPADWSEALGIISDDATHLRGELERVLHRRRQ